MSNKFSDRELAHIHNVLNLPEAAKGDAYDMASAKSNIDTWERDMDRLKDRIEFLQRKHKTMGQQLADAKKRFKGGDYDWIIKNLYTLGDLY